MAEERAMDRGASSATKTQDFADGIYEDVKTDLARGPVSLGIVGEVTAKVDEKIEASDEGDRKSDGGLPGAAESELGESSTADHSAANMASMGRGREGVGDGVEILGSQ